MKRPLLTPAAKLDRRGEVDFYRREAGVVVARKLIEALRKALHDLEQQPAMGSPTLGRQLGIEGLRTWGLPGFPLSLWYFEREEHVLVVRVIGHRREAGLIDVDIA